MSAALVAVMASQAAAALSLKVFMITAALVGFVLLIVSLAIPTRR